jgi:Xaa-Pro aminopeptidase
MGSMNTDRALHPISTAELERRWGAVRLQMQARHLDALVVQASQDWLGGYLKWFIDEPATNGYPCTAIFPADGPMTVVEQGPMNGRRSVRSDDPANRGIGLYRYTPSYSAIHYTRHYDAALVAEELQAAGHTRVGLVATAQMQYDFLHHLRETLPAVHFSDATDWVDDIKAIKSPEEQAGIRAAAALQDQVIAAVARWVTPGRRDFEIAAYAQYVAQGLGSEQGIFLGCSAPLGQPAVFLPRHQKGRELRAGEHFSLLVEVNGPGGFYTEIARTFVLGKAPQELVDGLETVKAAQQFMLAQMRPGAQPREIHAAFNDYMKTRGLPEETRLNAHGMGYDMVERPLIRHDETMPLAAGMNIVVHPGFVNERMFAVVCDNYLIGEQGPSACLHRTPQQIIEL